MQVGEVRDGQSGQSPGCRTERHLLPVDLQLKNLVARQPPAETDEARQNKVPFPQVEYLLLFSPLPPAAMGRESAKEPVHEQPAKPGPAEPPVTASLEHRVARKLPKQDQSRERQRRQQKQLEHSKQPVIQCCGLQAVNERHAQGQVTDPSRDVDEPIQRTPPFGTFPASGFRGAVRATDHKFHGVEQLVQAKRLVENRLLIESLLARLDQCMSRVITKTGHQDQGDRIFKLL